MTTKQRAKFALFGAMGGLLFGLTYWYAWGCRNCAKDESPWAIYAFCAVIGAIMTAHWAKDHIRT